MSWLDWLLGRRQPAAPATAVPEPAAPTPAPEPPDRAFADTVARVLAGVDSPEASMRAARTAANRIAREDQLEQRFRETVDRSDLVFTGGTAQQQYPFRLPAVDSLQLWRKLGLDDDTFDKLNTAQLTEILIDLEPNFSRAHADFIRMCNPGWEANCLTPGGAVDKRAQSYLDAFFDRLKGYYGSVDVVINRLYTSAYLRGALFAEIVLDERGREPVDLATPDPQSVVFQRVFDPVRGPIWVPGQYQVAEFKLLDQPTVRYIPIDPLPGYPRGRAMASAAVFPAVFQLGLLHDFRRVIAQQGYPRLDIELVLDELYKVIPPADRQNPEKVKDWIKFVLQEGQQLYQTLRPEDAYWHTSALKLNRPIGTIDSSSLGAADGLLNQLSLLLCRGLRTVPLLLGLPTQGSETHANRQWEVFAASCKSLQHLVESLLEYLLEQGLQAQGIATNVQFRFAELRAAELLRDAQVEQITVANAQAAYWAGWISQDIAAQKGVNVDKADVPEPRAMPSTETASSGPADASAAEADPGSNRVLPLTERPARMQEVA